MAAEGASASTAGGRDTRAGWLARALTAAAATEGSTANAEAPAISLASEADMDEVLRMITELAVFEKEPDGVKVTAETLREDGFGEQPLFWCLIAKNSEGKAVGMALTYISYSTWRGRTLYLEDLYVDPSARRTGLGSRMLRILALACVDTGIPRLTWQVLDWNESAISLYKKVGSHMSEWQTWRSEDDTLTALAERGPTAAAAAE